MPKKKVSNISWLKYLSSFYFSGGRFLDHSDWFKKWLVYHGYHLHTIRDRPGYITWKIINNINIHRLSWFTNYDIYVYKSQHWILGAHPLGLKIASQIVWIKTDGNYPPRPSMKKFHCFQYCNCRVLVVMKMFSEEEQDTRERKGEAREEDKSRNRTTFHKQRGRYKGRQSEGNRYIINMQL